VQVRGEPRKKRGNGTTSQQKTKNLISGGEGKNGRWGGETEPIKEPVMWNQLDRSRVGGKKLLFLKTGVHEPARVGGGRDGGGMGRVQSLNREID